MDALTDWLIGFVSRENNPAGLAVLAGSAALEYVVPPFPGDTITLLGAVLITAYGWSFWAVFGAVMVGSTAGAMTAFWAGLALRRRQDRRERAAAADPGAVRPDSPRWFAVRRATRRIIAGFHRHGAIYLILNRFLPGVRSLFFVAAGMAGMRARTVALYSALSAGLWNLALMALGATFGANFDTLLGWVRTYTTAVWIALAIVAAVVIARALYRRRRR